MDYDVKEQEKNNVKFRRLSQSVKKLCEKIAFKSNLI